ncbi:MAG: hypothetical protein HQK96_11520 [Nitrospirae bacterium]|nr:hypothetical protein [Nitrospirota bacterium]
MKIELSSFSIVVLAKTHNPSILNPDFLKLNGIVEQNFTPYDVLCTPPASHVFYKESLSIIAEFERLQFIDEDRVRIPYDSPIPYIAIKYVDVLPHVRYMASGINFVGHYVFPGKDIASFFISNTFIKNGPWSVINGQRPDVGIKFAYNVNDVLCNITIETAETNPGTIGADRAEGEYGDVMMDELPPLNPVVLVKANYHLAAKEAENKRIKMFIAKWYTYFEEFHNFLEGVFPAD